MDRMGRRREGTGRGIAKCSHLQKGEEASCLGVFYAGSPLLPCSPSVSGTIQVHRPCSWRQVTSLLVWISRTGPLDEVGATSLPPAHLPT